MDKFEHLPLVAGWEQDDWKIVLGQGGNSWPIEYDGEPVTLEHIGHVHAMYSTYSTGEWDGMDLAALMELTDGQWATLHAGCDYTGWGCQDYVRWRRFNTKDEAVAMGLTNQSREWLKMELPHG